MLPKTRGGSTAARRSERLNLSEIPAANIVDDVGEDQVDKSTPVNSSPVHDVSDPAASKEIEMDMEEDTEPLQPENFFFSHNDYGKSCKLSTKCSIAKTLEALEKLDKTEMKWFREHKQFKHIWHLARQEKNKLTGMWMLLLRTASTQKKKVRWFVVNGVPIRYSMREHALITGFDCHEYDSCFDEEKVGRYDFVERVFGTKKVKVKDVRMKLESIDDTCGGDRLQVAVLYFLSTVIRGMRRFDTIYPFILKIVNDLKAVETFPWGRITFEDNLKEIDHAMNHFDGRVQDDYLFPGFIIPLEVLAFICIPELSKRFQEDISGAKDGCPLMCKKKFKDNGMPGFPLGDLNDALGKTDDIISILEPSSPEEAFLLDIMERDEDEDSIDHIADAWNERLDVQKKKICWEKLYKLDVAARGFGEINIPSVEGMGEPQHANVPVAKHIPEPQLPEHWMIKKMKSMEDEIKELKMRLAIVERNQNPNSALRESEYQKEAETVATRDKGKDGEEEVTGEKTDDYVRTGEEMDADMRTGGDTMVDDKRTGGETMVGHETADDMRTGGELVDDDTVAGYEMAGDDEMRADGHMVGDYDMVGDGTVAGDKTVGVEMVGDEKAVNDKTCARKKGQMAPKRKPKPSIHITEPYTVEKNKQKKLKKQRKDDNMKEKK